MKTPPFEIEAKVWLYEGENPWHFVTIKRSDAEEISKEYIWPRRGFGAIPVVVKIGKTKWQTSIFPEKGGTYLLPLKKSVREAENIKIGSLIKITLRVIV